MGLADEAAALYAVPAQEFTARRAARAKELRGDDGELADAVARLPKPAVAAAALNRLAREHGDLIDALLDLASELRQAQAGCDGARLRALTADAHEAVRRALAAVEGLSDAQLGQAEQTLRAAMADEGAGAAVRAGLLVKPLSPAGFGTVDLTGAVAVVPEPRRARPLRAARQPGARRQDRAARKEQERDAARQRAEEALAALAEARAASEEASSELREAEDDHRTAEERQEELRAALTAAEHAVREAAEQARRARHAHEKAEQRADAAATRAARAKEELDRLEA